MEFVFIFAVAVLKVFFINPFEVVEIIGAFGIDTFMYGEVLPLFLWDEGVAAVRAAQLHGREPAVPRGESGTAYLAEDLAFGAVVPVEVWHGRVTARTGAVLRDTAFRAAVYRPDLLPVAFFEIGDKLLVSPALAEVGNKRERIDLELLVFRGMGIIKGPLFEGDVSADETDQPAVLLVKVLN